jgi:hypothetical protein
VLFLDLLSQHGDSWEAIALDMGTKSAIQVMAFYKANTVELQLDGILETYKRKKGLSPYASANGTPIDVGTPISDPPPTATPSLQGSPAPPSISTNNSVPLLVGPKVYPYGFPPQAPAGGWPMAPLGTNPADYMNMYHQVPHGYPSTSAPSSYHHTNHHLHM